MEKIKSIFKKRPRLIGGLVVILALSLPFIVNQVLKEQDIRQGAQTLTPVNVTFSPTSGNYDLTTNEIQIDLIIDTKAYDISAIEGVLKYDSTKLRFLVAKPTGPYTVFEGAAIPPDNLGYSYKKITLYNPQATPITGQSVKAVSFIFKPLSAGTASVDFSSRPQEPPLLIVASGISGNITTITPGGIGSYTITTATPSLTVVPTDGTGTCNNLSNRENGCKCEFDAQCSTKNCSGPTPALGTETGICVALISPVPSLTQIVTPSFTPTRTTTPSFTPSPTNRLSPTHTPTPTYTPTPTFTPGSTILNLSVSLPGIGKASGDNTSPTKSSRATSVVIYDTKDTAVTNKINGNLAYNSTTGRYEGSIDLQNQIASQSGNYSVRVKMDNTLVKRIPGIVTITKGQTVSTSNIRLVTGDVDQNNVLTISDYTTLISCYRATAGCTSAVKPLADLNDNGVTTGDTDDYNLLQFGFSVRSGD